MIVYRIESSHAFVTIVKRGEPQLLVLAIMSNLSCNFSQSTKRKGEVKDNIIKYIN